MTPRGNEAGAGARVRPEPGSTPADELQTAHGRFLRAARERPGAPALFAGDEALTYGDLRERALHAAGTLRAAGVGAETVVGIALPRTADAIVAVLGIHLAGGAYLPLDPVHPLERRRYMLEDA